MANPIEQDDLGLPLLENPPKLGSFPRLLRCLILASNLGHTKKGKLVPHGGGGFWIIVPIDRTFPYGFNPGPRGPSKIEQKIPPFL